MVSLRRCLSPWYPGSERRHLCERLHSQSCWTPCDLLQVRLSAPNTEAKVRTIFQEGRHYEGPLFMQGAAERGDMFPKLGVPYFGVLIIIRILLFGVLIIRILLFGVLYSGPLFSETGPDARAGQAFWTSDQLGNLSSHSSQTGVPFRV